MEETLDKRSLSAGDEASRVLALKLKDRSYFITKSFTIGRYTRSEIPLPRDVLISRRHARIEYEQGLYHIQDLHSKNGTYLNGEPLVGGQKYLLSFGDTVTIGKTVITVSSAGVVS